MEYTHLGRSGLSVSRLCLGTMNFGLYATEDISHAILDRAHEIGVNFVDTADVYGGEGREGTAEEIVGRWFMRGGRRREKTVLGTKVYGTMDDWPNNRHLSALHIRRACEESLRRLGTDYIDIYHAHHVDRMTPPDEFWDAMDTLRAQGKVIYVGSSNFPGWHIAKTQEAARRRGHGGLVSEQTHYNLMERTAELEVLPACADYGLGFTAWSPLEGGLLGGAVRGSGDGRRGSDETRTRLAEHRTAIKEYEAFCEEIGADAATVALAWLLSNENVTAPVVGPRTVEQLDSAAEAVSTRLGSDALARLDSIFPGPGPAPEAYAW